MADKIVIDCSINQVQEVSFTDDEQMKRELDFQALKEQMLLHSLIPSNEEIAQAEFELKTITLLTEVGLL